MKVYAFMYNPMTEESGYITVSLHKTRDGAEKALESHKTGRKLQWDELEKYRREKYADDLYETIRKGTKFGRWEDWTIEERTILD